jgi:hypothetical protein
MVTINKVLPVRTLVLVDLTRDEDFETMLAHDQAEKQAGDKLLTGAEVEAFIDGLDELMFDARQTG